MRHFGPGDVAVRARRAAAVLDDPGRFEVVDMAALETVGVRGIPNDEVVSREPRSLNAEGAQPPVLRKLPGSKRHLQRDACGDGIEDADGGVTLRLRRHDRTGDPRLFDDPSEVSGAVHGRDRTAESPE